MKDLAPDIYRQRLLIEGIHSIEVNESTIKEYFKHISAKLNLKIYSEPIIFSPAGLGGEENQGYDAFVPLIDSGISLYAWTKSKFLSIIIYTCKGFSEEDAIHETKKFFEIQALEYNSF